MSVQTSADVFKSAAQVSSDLLITTSMLADSDVSSRDKTKSIA